jgi:hypothetical protein
VRIETQWGSSSPEMKKLFQIIVVIAAIALSNPSVRACSCADPSQREKFRKADVVFLGEIVESTYLNPIPKDSEFAQSARFAVKRQWKVINPVPCWKLTSIIKKVGPS